MSGHPFKVKAVFEYNSPHDEDLKFPEGQIITVTEDDEEDWYTGEYVDGAGVKKEGIFPRNFVEKYEPTAPPRPTRARPKKDTESASSTGPPDSTSQAPARAEPPQEPPHEEIQERAINYEGPQATVPVTAVAPAPAPVHTEAPPAATKPPPKPAPAVARNSVPPPVSEKPGGTFRDRIAAFNKSAAPPPAPFKPGGLGSGGSGFIKKPFVAPPPSKDAFVPHPREAAPQKMYRRDEDPEIAAKEVENLENAERAGLAPTANDGGGEDQPKPTSLKERIALLQKQQMEQAARHADAAQKKEKPKRPVKKRTESHNVAEAHEEEELVLEKQDSHGTIGKKSMDSDDPSAARAIPRRRPSKSTPAIPGIPRESFGDGNEADMSGAGDTTEEPEEVSTGHDDSDERPKAKAALHAIRGPAAIPHEPDFPEEGDDDEGHEEEVAEDGEEVEEEEEEEEEDIDPEVRRREELRARMAKMSGGMGMVGMFGGGMPMPGPALPPKKKPSGASEKKQSSEYSRDETTVPAGRAPPVPGVALPGMTRVKSPEETNKQLEVEHEDDDQDDSITESRPADEVPDIEDVKPSPPARTKTGSRRESYAAPPVPGGRPAPPPVPTEARPPPPPPPTMLMSASAGSESDDEMSIHAPKLSVETPTSEASQRAVPPRPSGPPVPSRPADGPTSPRSPTSKRASYFSNEPTTASPTTLSTSSKRASRVPPIPGSNPVVTSTQNRAPPPPPPGTSISRSSTGDSRVLQTPTYTEQDESEEEITEYEGDYDTDIASKTPHKDALKSHVTESSLDDNTPARSTVVSPSGAPPPLPPMTTHRAVPPPLPAQPPPNSRTSADMPRAAPPPPPPPKEQSYDEDDEDDEYDPYRYTVPKQGIPIVGMATPGKEKEEDDLYSASPPRSQPPRPQDRAAPPPPPRESVQLPPLSSNRGPPRQSIDVQKTQATSRRSTDLNRLSMDSGFVANDVDLGQASLWWIQPNSTPPIFQNRKDILYETEEAISTKRGGKSTATRDLYILFQDYSQTVITVRYDPHNPADANLEQRHESPPSRLRQDQLEESYERFGRRIAEAVASKKDNVVGDGTPAALITELLKPFPDALLPVGTRAYGALVYSNLANASTIQNDEIRPGDIITFRNAKFQGKHGPMHAKYSVEVGGSGVGHVGVVAEWDGTKKKVRTWEQGREKKKLGLESFKLDDLRSGEVKIWRVMERGWVGWEGTN